MKLATRVADLTDRYQSDMALYRLSVPVHDCRNVPREYVIARACTFKRLDGVLVGVAEVLPATADGAVLDWEGIQAVKGPPGRETHATVLGEIGYEVVQ